MKDLPKEYQDDMKKQIMHLKEQYNKTLMVDIGWISTQTRFFQDKTGFLIFTDSYIKVSKFKALNDFK